MARFDEVSRVLDQAVSRGDVAGVVAGAVLGVSEHETHRWASGETGHGAPMSNETVFWLGSMTKALTSVGAMQLVERGKIDLGQDAGDYLPEIERLQVLDGFEPDGSPRLRPRVRCISLLDLLTHTSGFGYETWYPEVRRFREFYDVPRLASGHVASLALPAVADPGSRWVYGTGMDWIGRVIEVVSGLSLRDYLRDHVFDPLGMSSTDFILDDRLRSRLAGIYTRSESSQLEGIDFEFCQEPEVYMGGGALYSTANDYLRFCRMVLSSGELDGQRVLSPESVAMMGQNQIGDLWVEDLRSCDAGASLDVPLGSDPRNKWGIGFMVSDEDVAGGPASGTLSWCGVANTYFWVDRARSIAGVFMTQVLPLFDHRVRSNYLAFERAIYAEG